MHHVCMGVLVQIRDVDESVRDTLKARAAARGQSLNSYLRALLTETARRPSRADTLARIDRRVETSSRSAVEIVRAERDAR